MGDLSDPRDKEENSTSITPNLEDPSDKNEDGPASEKESHSWLADLEDGNPLAGDPENPIEIIESSADDTVIQAQTTVDSSLGPPYSVFSKSFKFLIIVIASITASFSALSSNIYLPALGAIERAFNLSLMQANLTIVLYLIAQGIAPTLFGSIADTAGRRPTYLVCCLGYLAVNIGLARANTYWLILVLRLGQSFTMSSTVAMGSGVVTDLTTREDRGQFIGLLQGFILIGTAVGPIIGGGLAQGLGWRSIFWFLAISSGVTLVLLICTFPETLRSIVGNGSLKPPLISRSIYSLIRPPVYWKQPPDTSTLAPKRGFAPWSTLVLLGETDVFFVLLSNAVAFAAWSTMLASLTTLFQDKYNLGELQIGLCYIAGGVGGILGSLTAGRLLNRDYRKALKKYQLKKLDRLDLEGVSKSDLRHIDMSDFPLQKARLEKTRINNTIFIGCLLIMGWSLEYNVSLAVPVLFSFICCWSSVGLMSASNTLLVDLFPNQAASVTSCVNLTRCLLSAVGVAVLERMLTSLKAGGTYTVLAGITGIAHIGFELVMRYGRKWEMKRQHRREAKKQ